MEAALAFLSTIDPLMFEIAMDAADLITGAAPETKPPGTRAIPVCRRCGGQVAIFPDHGLHWQHFRGDGTTSGAQEIYDPGHPAEVTWRLPDEDPAPAVAGGPPRCPAAVPARRGTGTRRAPRKPAYPLRQRSQAADSPVRAGQRHRCTRFGRIPGPHPPGHG